MFYKYMSNKNIKEVLDSTQNILSIMNNTNNIILKQTDRLNIVLFNLKIEEARIKENTGIVPIANELDKIIKLIHNEVQDSINQYNNELKTNFKIIEEELLKDK